MIRIKQYWVRCENCCRETAVADLDDPTEWKEPCECGASTWRWYAEIETGRNNDEEE